MTQATEISFAARRLDDFRLIATLSAAHFISHYYILTLPPLFGFIRADYGLSYTEIGLALTAFNAVSAVLQTVTGFVVDRFNARLVLVAGLLCGAMGLTLAATIDSYWMLIAGFALMGLGNTVYHPADYALLSRHIAPERISQAYSVHTFSGMLGSAAAPSSILLMYGLFGWRGAFLGAAMLGFAVAVLLLFQPDPGSGRAGRPRPTSQVADPGWRILISPPILVSFLFFGVLAFGSFGIQNFGVVALGALHGTSPASANAGLTGYLMMSAMGVLAGGYIAARISRHALAAALGILGAACGAIIIGSFPLGPVALIVVMSMAGFCIGTVMPSRDMIVREVTPPGAFGRVFGFVTNGFNIGAIFSPLVFGALMDRGQPYLVFVVIAGASLFAIATIASVPRRRA